MGGREVHVGREGGRKEGWRKGAAIKYAYSPLSAHGFIVAQVTKVPTGIQT